MVKEYIIKIDEDQSKKDIHGGYPLIEPPLELVRCKDCKYSGHCDTEDFHRCADPDGWFCADGERKA